MAVYLNTNKPLENYKELFNEEYFVDKTKIINLLNNRMFTKSKYVCITRPRRFGKSSVADMLGAYYSKATDSKEIFDKLEISKVNNYEEHLNKYNVISISFNKIPEKGSAFNDYMEMIKTSLINDIKDIFFGIDEKNILQ